MCKGAVVYLTTFPQERKTLGYPQTRHLLAFVLLPGLDLFFLLLSFVYFLF